MEKDKKNPGDGLLVPVEGFEPTRPDGHYVLNVARLPVPPHRHIRKGKIIEFSLSAQAVYIIIFYVWIIFGATLTRQGWGLAYYLSLTSFFT